MEADRPKKGFGRRCDLGCESWPDDDEYSECPICGEQTERYSNLYPLDRKEAALNKARIDFETYYERHCELLGIPVEGPLPEAEECH